MLDDEVECGICEKPVDTQKGDYEYVEFYLQGDLEDSGYIHTKCRLKQEERASKRSNSSVNEKQ